MHFICLMMMDSRYVYVTLNNFHSLKQFRGDQYSTGSVEETPLAHACATGNLKMVKLLVENGANMNQLCSVSIKVSLSLEKLLI